MDSEALKLKIGNLPTIKSDVFEDNIATALCCYFERHCDRPIDDPDDEDCPGWGVWVVEKMNELIDSIVDAVIEHLEEEKE